MSEGSVRAKVVTLSGNGCATRAPWVTPRVILSDLGDAKANVDFGGDGSVPSYGPYGS